MSKLSTDVLGLVDFAIRALMDYLWRAGAQSENFVRHHPWFDQHIRIVNGHLEKNLVALPRELFNDVQVGGMEEPAASEPGCIDEVGGIDHQRVALPFTNRKPEVEGFDSVGTRGAVGRDVAEFSVSTAVIACRIQKEDVGRRLKNARRRTLPRESHRLACHDRIFLICPLIEFLNLVPKLGLVQGMARPKPRG